MRISGCCAGLAALLLAFSPPGWSQGDPEAGRVKAVTCMGCHGIETYSNAYPTYRVPKLGGQHAEYIVAALNAYKSEARQHPTMHSQAAALSDQDIQDIAAFLSRAPKADRLFAFGWLHPAAEVDDPEKAAQLATPCAACHEADGVPANPMYPILAGQHEDYLERALKQYRDGGRQNPIMNGLAANLSDEDIEALAAHFAALPGPLHTPTTSSRVAHDR
jgi:cytochrome c553